MEPWTFKREMERTLHEAPTPPQRRAARLIMLELDRLAIQQCRDCDGWGHSEKDCPTSSKVTLLAAPKPIRKKVLKAAYGTIGWERGRPIGAIYSKLLRGGPPRGWRRIKQVRITLGGDKEELPNASELLRKID